MRGCCGIGDAVSSGPLRGSMAQGLMGIHNVVRVRIFTLFPASSVSLWPITAGWPPQEHCHHLPENRHRLALLCKCLLQNSFSHPPPGYLTSSSVRIAGLSARGCLAREGPYDSHSPFIVCNVEVHWQCIKSLCWCFLHWLHCSVPFMNAAFTSE